MGAVTRPSSGDRAEHISLLGHQLDPSSAREARVTKQSAAPVAIFLTCAVLFFTSCVFVLVLGAHPAAGRANAAAVAPISSLRYARGATSVGDPESALEARDAAIARGLTFDPRWFRQGGLAPDESLSPVAGAAEAPQLGFERWRGAPFWRRFRAMPVSFNRPRVAMREEPLVVATHAPARADAPLWAASLKKHGLAAAQAGEGTRGSSDASDAIIGLKAALMSLGSGGDESAAAASGEPEPDPLVVFADAPRALFACDADEMTRRFEKLGADLVVSADGVAAELGFGAHEFHAARATLGAAMAEGLSEVRSDEGRIPGEYVGDAAAAATSAPPLPDARAWPGGAAMIGRRSKMLELVRDVETFLTEDAQEEAEEEDEAEGSRRRSGAFRASCFKKKGEGSNSEGGGSFDARACVARYVVERARARDARVKLDRDGTLVHATRGTAPGAYGRNAYEKPYWRETKKAPCVWRFDDAAAGAGDMMDMIARFPGAFV